MYWLGVLRFNTSTNTIKNRVPVLSGMYALLTGAAGKLSRTSWVIATGEHDSIVQQNRDFSQMLWNKGIANHLEIWPGVFGHDWPWWRENLRRFV